MEKRRHPRIGFSVPVSCAAVEAPQRFSMGVIRDLSQGGAALEVTEAPDADSLMVSFIDSDNRVVEIKARVKHSQPGKSGKARLGICFEGSAKENAEFVAQLIRFNSSRKRREILRQDGH
jgi:hypothetical protein